MESEILQTLKEIRGTLYVIATVLTVGVVFWIFSSGSVLYTVFRSIIKKDWKEQANEFFDAEKYEELFAHCKEREKTHRNDPNVYYWQARIHHVKGEKEKAGEMFSMVSKIAPDWHKDYVEPYLEK